MNQLAHPEGSARTASIDAAKVVRLMLAFFGDSEVPRAQQVAADALPAPYRRLLVHSGHMTEALERHHGCALAVQPYRIRREGEIYGRRLDLRLADGSGPVMTGIMIFNLALVSATVREQIVQAKVPLGRILIQHRILRRVVSDAYLRFEADDPLVARFGLHDGGQDGAHQPLPAYGRIATIDCDQRPAVDLLEIVRPCYPPCCIPAP